MNIISDDILFKNDIKDKIQLIKIFINKFGKQDSIDSIDNIIKIKWNKNWKNFFSQI